MVTFAIGLLTQGQRPATHSPAVVVGGAPLSVAEAAVSAAASMVGQLCFRAHRADTAATAPTFKDQRKAGQPTTRQSQCVRAGCGRVDEALARTGAFRGQRDALPTAIALDHMTTASHHSFKLPSVDAA